MPSVMTEKSLEIKKITFGLRDSLFGHAKAASNGNLGVAPKQLIFDRSDGPHKVTFFTDLDLSKVATDRSELKVAWLIESPEVHRQSYEQIKSPAFYNMFDLVLTFDKRLLNLDSRFILTPAGGCWIPESRRRLYGKTKQLSIIASSKTELRGQRLRGEIVERFKDSIEGIFGRGYLELEDKTDGLQNYRYSLVVENCRADFYFTEKLVDCFATGTVPIYWGCPDIGKFFNTDGVISFESIDDLDHIIRLLSEEDYESRQQAIKSNFEKSNRYVVTEDYIFNEVVLKHPVFKPFLKFGVT